MANYVHSCLLIYIYCDFDIKKEVWHNCFKLYTNFKQFKFIQWLMPDATITRNVNHNKTYVNYVKQPKLIKMCKVRKSKK